MDLQKEFERQEQNLLQKGYPDAAGISEKEFLKFIEPLRDKIDELPDKKVDLKAGKLPFVIVIKSELISTETAMSLVEKNDKEGITKLYPHEPENFKIVDEVEIPDSMAYLLVDIDRGKKNINLPPRDAWKLIQKKERSPLTIDEGIAIVTQHPEFLMRNNCFSLLASRNPNNKRVPAIWINAKKHPNLGWCWEGNPHTWLGSASCKERLA